MSRKSKILFPGIALVILLPWLNQAFKFIPNPNLENRKMADFPEFKMDDIDEYPLRLDTFFSDNFSLRAASMKVNGRLNLFAFKKSPIPEIVYYGKDGWMFFTGEELKTFDGTLKFSHGQTDSIIDKLRYRKDYYHSKGIDYYMFIIPVKNVLYADKQTDALYSLKKKNRTDYFIEDVKEAMPDFKLFYLKDDLEKARKIENESPLFWKTDNHWNKMGAYYGAGSILRRLNKDGYNVVDMLERPHKKDSVFGFFGNLSYYTGLKGVAKEWDYYMSFPEQFVSEKIENYPCETPKFAHSWEYQYRYRNKDTSLARVLYIRDSFGSDMVPILAEGSGESLFIFDGWKYGTNQQWIDMFKPKVVVHVMLERYLENLLTKTPYPEG